MAFKGEYVPSASQWVADQVAEYEASGGTRANTLRESGIPVIIVTMQGLSSNVRKIALIRVEHQGEYALVASMGGAPQNPKWYQNLVANPLVQIQDGPLPNDYAVRELFGSERDEWFRRGIAVYPHYEDHQAKTDRTIPVFVASRLY